MLCSPIGRTEIKGVVLHDLWPVTGPLAGLYRRTLLRRVHVVAVVGSFGKTTTARALLAALGKPANPGVQLNARGYVPGALLRMRPSDATGVLEAGIAGPGKMASIAATVRPDVAVVTSIGSEHNLSLGSLEVTRDEKAGMVRILPPAGIAVLNGDDPNVVWMATQTRARVITCGFDASNQVRASQVRLDWPHGTRFRLHTGGQERDVRIQLLGRHLIFPVLAASAVALAEGHHLDDIVARLEGLTPTPGRLAPCRLDNGATILYDDLKSGLETIHAALDVLAEIPAERKIVVLGPVNEPVGKQGPLYRALGARIAQAAHLAFCVDSYPEYRAGLALAGMPREACVDAGHGISGAVELLRRTLRAGDVVLIKGRHNQKLERIGLALEGKPVGCLIDSCQVRSTQCHHCSAILGDARLP